MEEFSMKRFIVSLLLALFTVALFTGCSTSKQKLSDEEIVSIAKKVYIYGYAPLLMKYTELKQTNVEEPNNLGMAPVNQISHFRTFPDASFKDVVKPNVDTYYSIVWFELKDEPMVMTVPATERYYLLPLLDAYSNVFKSPGTRTTGNGAHTFLLVGPGWKGEVPQGMELIQAPTNTVWLIARVQVNSPEDGATVVRKFQDGLKVIPLSKFGKPYTPPKGKVNPAYQDLVPVKAVRSLSIEQFFNELSQWMAHNPPLPFDKEILAEMKKIGFEVGKPWSMKGFSGKVQKELAAIPEQVHQGWEELAKNPDPSTLKNGWMYLTNLGYYGNNYDLRAYVAFMGLGANLPEDAIYPIAHFDSEGKLFDGKYRYVIHFDKDKIPPVKAFWSLTCYTEDDFLVPNPINRYALGDRDPLKYNKDGSLDLYIQANSPGKAKEANWLPCPKEGHFNLTLRLYWPKEEVIKGEWVPPAVQRVE
jgi:hypothetical protein